MRYSGGSTSCWVLMRARVCVRARLCRCFCTFPAYDIFMSYWTTEWHVLHWLVFLNSLWLVILQSWARSSEAILHLSSGSLGVGRAAVHISLPTELFLFLTIPFSHHLSSQIHQLQYDPNSIRSKCKRDQYSDNTLDQISLFEAFLLNCQLPGACVFTPEMNEPVWIDA